MPEIVAIVNTTGIVCTNNATYNTIDAMHAAGATAFPGYDGSGLYPNSLVLTSLNAAGTGAGDLFTFTTNPSVANNATPSGGVLVEGGGQQFVVLGNTPEGGFRLIQNVWIISKKTNTDLIHITAMY